MERAYSLRQWRGVYVTNNRVDQLVDDCLLAAGRDSFGGSWLGHWIVLVKRIVDEWWRKDVGYLQCRRHLRLGKGAGAVILREPNFGRDLACKHLVATLKGLGLFCKQRAVLLSEPALRHGGGLTCKRFNRIVSA